MLKEGKNMTNFVKEMRGHLDIVKDASKDEPIPIQSVVYLGLNKFGKEEIHDVAGINWGQRDGRNRNQAYIPIPASIYNSGFFPGIGVHFSVTTDDRKVLTFVRAQERGKALHTPNDNAELGEYFRERMGIPSGSKVTFNNLSEYGRTYVTIAKKVDSSYFMDFGIPPMIISSSPFPVLCTWKGAS